MASGFKQFVLRGNVVDMVVGVVVGGAFAAVVAALTKDLLTPLIAALVGKPDFSAIFTVNGSVFALGDFINALVSFLLIAAVIYFFVILPINALTTEESKLIGKVFADHAHGMEDALSCLDDSQKETLKNLLRKVSHTAENRPSVDSSIG
jgi:large conductance mechanosensitive channel